MNIRLALAALAVAIVPACASLADPMGSAFTYQGQLKTSGAPATGAFDLSFRLFDTSMGGSQIGSTVNIPSASVANGLFTAKLDFGATGFEGSKRWLEISVKPAGTSVYTTLTPRQEITPTPYSITTEQLVLPFSQAASSSIGIGTSGLFHIGQQGAGHAIAGQTSGPGAGIFGMNTNTTGSGGKFLNSNPGSTDPVVYASNGGSGWGVEAHSHLGRAGSFEIANPANPHIALFATTIGSGHAIQGYATGTGKGVGGYHNGTSGQAGYFRIGNEQNNSDALYVETISGGKAIAARSVDGPAVYARVSGDGPALQTDGGGLKVTGAGLGTNTWVYIHQVTSSNISGTRSYLNNPQCNNKPNAILFVTNAFNGGTVNPHAVAVNYDSGNGRWYLHNVDNEDMTNTTRFNVMIVLP